MSGYSQHQWVDTPSTRRILEAMPRHLRAGFIESVSLLRQAGYSRDEIEANYAGREVDSNGRLTPHRQPGALNPSEIQRRLAGQAYRPRPLPPLPWASAQEYRRGSLARNPYRSGTDPARRRGSPDSHSGVSRGSLPVHQRRLSRGPSERGSHRDSSSHTESTESGDSYYTPDPPSSRAYSGRSRPSDSASWEYGSDERDVGYTSESGRSDSELAPSDSISQQEGYGGRYGSRRSGRSRYWSDRSGG